MFDRAVRTPMMGRTQAAGRTAPPGDSLQARHSAPRSTTGVGFRFAELAVERNPRLLGTVAFRRERTPSHDRPIQAMFGTVTIVKLTKAEKKTPTSSDRCWKVVTDDLTSYPLPMGPWVRGAHVTFELDDYGRATKVQVVSATTNKPKTLKRSRSEMNSPDEPTSSISTPAIPPLMPPYPLPRSNAPEATPVLWPMSTTSPTALLERTDVIPERLPSPPLVTFGLQTPPTSVLKGRNLLESGAGPITRNEQKEEVGSDLAPAPLAAPSFPPSLSNVNVNANEPGSAVTPSLWDSLPDAAPGKKSQATADYASIVNDEKAIAKALNDGARQGQFDAQRWLDRVAEIQRAPLGVTGNTSEAKNLRNFCRAHRNQPAVTASPQYLEFLHLSALAIATKNETIGNSMPNRWPRLNTIQQALDVSYDRLRHGARTVPTGALFTTGATTSIAAPGGPYAVGSRAEVVTAKPGARFSGEDATARRLETHLTDASAEHGQRTSWVAGHLVASTLGGKDIDANLTPMTNDFNTRRMAEPEVPTRDILNRGGVIHYRSEATYGHAGRGDIFAAVPTRITVKLDEYIAPEGADTSTIRSYTNKKRGPEQTFRLDTPDVPKMQV